MRNLELFVDSKLKEFNLYKYMEQILREGSAEVEDDVSIDEAHSIALFKDFVDLATLLDTYQNWTQEQWTNFLVQMMIAFKEKGKSDSVNCALAALGISTKSTATLENSPDGLSTTLTVTLSNLNTPNITNFLDRFESLLPKLLWTHELDTSGVNVEQVTVKILIDETYDQTMFDKAIRYSVPNAIIDTSLSGSEGWGV